VGDAEPEFFSLPPKVPVNWCSLCGAVVALPGIIAHREDHQDRAELAAAVEALRVSIGDTPERP
jgi:hypothetical protein